MTQLFPSYPIDTCDSFAQSYFEEIFRASKTVDASKLEALVDAIGEVISQDRFIFICGNGGSAAIANHSLCDFLKCVRTDTGLAPRVISLSAHTELNSALANDISYDEAFAYQLQSMARKNDFLLTISSSGDSQNVVRAIETAREIEMKTASFTGFSGGRSRTMADINVHVDAHNYGVVEDIHMGFIHVVTQFLRMKNMDSSLVGQRKF
jgi:D-sedoheptulose 7-phosphate isomerase